MFQSVIDALAANVVLIGLLIGAVTPLVTAVMQQPWMTNRARGLVAAGVSVLVGFVIAASTGTITDPGSTLAVIGAVLVASEAFYQKVWAATGATSWVERFTSPK